MSNKGEVCRWSCSSCTFINDSASSRGRCSMCGALRPRTIPISLTPVRCESNFATDIIDLTESNKSNTSHNEIVKVASTESARKRKRQQRNGSELKIVNKNTNKNGRDGEECHRQGKKQERRKEGSNIHDDCAFGFQSKMHADFSTKFKSKVSKKKETKATSLSTSKPKSKSGTKQMVQRTLFGSIIRDIQETDVNQLSNKPEKIKRRSNHKSSSLEHVDDDEDFEGIQSKSNVNVNTNTYISTSKSTTFDYEHNYEKLHKRAMNILSQTFKIPTLRNLQPLAIQSALQRKSQIIVMATGGGKSLCYQLPAVVLKGVAIVVSPLIALMVDQVNGLRAKGIEAVFISSSVGEKDKKTILKRLVGGGDSGKGGKSGIGIQKQIKLLYCTPELIQTSRFRAVLFNLYNRKLLSMVAIDEAHCLSTWGHDFRPAYRKLSWLRTSFPDVAIMALTATATQKVIQDIRDVLCLNSSDSNPKSNGQATKTGLQATECEIHMSTFNRPNLSYEVRYKDSMGSDDVALKDLVKTVKNEHQKADAEGVPCSGIVYVHKRDDTNVITATLIKAGISAAPYHAGLKDADRKRIQQEWTDGIIDCCIATVAFGMGIDLAYVRYVLHWSMSKTVEGFYQESGRAGRDGLPSKSIVYYSKDDASKFAFLIRKNSERKDAKGVKSSSVDDRSLQALKKMVEFCTSPSCRRKFLLKHFGEDIEPEIICKKTCDYCRDPQKVEKALNTSSVSKAIRDVKNQRFKYKKEVVLDGTFNHGVESDEEDNDNGNWNYTSISDTGLGITCAPSSSSGFTTGGGKALKGFRSAKSILSRYESMESRSSSGRQNGFVHFKAKQRIKDMNIGEEREENGYSEPKKSTSVSVPSHIMQQIEAKVSHASDAATEKPKEKNSKDLSLDADRVRAELEEIRIRKEKLLAKFRNRR